MGSLSAVLAGAGAAALAAGVIYQQVGSRRDARRWPPPGRAIDVGGRRLHLHCLGEGRCSVIFESGLGASSLNWRPLQEAVAGFARACAYDRAGYGWSDRAAGPRTARAAAADLHRLLRAAGVPPPYILVGHSFGSYVAPVFAAEHLEDVAGLVLLDPITPDDYIAPDRAQRRVLIGGSLFSTMGAALASIGVLRFLLNRVRPGMGGSSLPAAALGLFGREADTVVRRLLGEVTKMPPAVWPIVQAHWSRPGGFLTMARYFRALPRSAAETRTALAPAPDAPCPLAGIPLVVISAANCSEERAQRQRLVSELSHAGAHLRASAGGHWVHLDNPALVIDAIRRLVDATTDGAARVEAPQRSK